MRKIYSMASFESIDDEEVPAGTEDAAALQAEAVVTEQENDIADLTGAIEDLAEGADQMEGVADRMEDSLADGGEGYAPEAAAEATAALESLYKRIGLRVKAMPSLESFGGRNSRRSATQYAVEAIKEQIKKVWMSIKKFFKDMWDKLVGFYNSIFDGAIKLKARAKAMAEKIAKETGSIKETSFENKSVVKEFAIAGVYTKGNELKIIGHTKQALEAANTLFLKGDTVIAGINKMVESIKTKDEQKTRSSFKLASKIMTDAIVSSVSGFKTVKGSGNSAVTNLLNDARYKSAKGFISSGLLNDRVLLLVTSELANDKTDEEEIVFKASLVPGSENTKEPTNLKVDTLELSVMTEITNAVTELADLMLGLKSNASKAKEFSSQFDKIISEAENITDSNTEENKKVIRKAFNDLRKIVPAAGATLKTAGSTMIGVGLATGNAALNCCGASLSNYGSK